MDLTVSDVMTKNPVVCGLSTSVAEAARLMRDHGIGDVLVSDGSQFVGIVTDRDIVVRCIADGGDTAQMTIGDVCSDEVASVEVDATVDTAARLMRDIAVRRLPVMNGNRLVGIVTLGDLAVSVEPQSALADISAAEPNE
jgi:CBS domain-containing protein